MGGDLSRTAPLTETGQHLLETRGLVKSYRKRRVVDGVSIHVDRGEIVGLLGPNGAGKTTTFRMTVGMIPADQGQVLLRGKDVTRLPMYRRAREGMGYLSQEPSIFRRMTVRDNVLAVLEARRVPRAEREARAMRLLEELEIARLRDQFALTLSGGERRRLEITRALATEPALILLDEPFAGVDPLAVQDIQVILRKLRDAGIGILITDHHVEATLKVTERAYIIAEGKVLASGTPAQLTADPVVRRAYLGDTFGPMGGAPASDG